MIRQLLFPSVCSHLAIDQTGCNSRFCLYLVCRGVVVCAEQDKDVSKLRYNSAKDPKGRGWHPTSTQRACPHQVIPPLARIASPVTAVFISEQRNTMVGTTSSGVSSRRIGDVLAICSRI